MDEHGEPQQAAEPELKRPEEPIKDLEPDAKDAAAVKGGLKTNDVLGGDA